MTEPTAMPSVRRRPIPGMTRPGQSDPPSPPPAVETPPGDSVGQVDLDAIDSGETNERPQDSENGTKQGARESL